LIAQPLGAILAGLAIWLYACDRGNGLVPWVGLAGIVLLLIPAAFDAFLR
jgi:hypothetical protein